MSFQTKLVSLCRTLFRKDRLDRELDDELRAYVDLLTERKIRAGLDPGAARRAALVETGGVEQVKEQVRDARTGAWFDQVLQDVRIGLRMLRRAPSFVAVAVVTLALGIGANTAIFSVVYGVLLRPAPFADLDRLVMVWETDRHSSTTREPASVPDYLDFRARATRFEKLAALAAGEMNLTPAAGDPVRLVAMSVTHELLPMVGITPIVGRTFTEREDARRGPNVALISESLWERSLGRDPAVVGETLRLDEKPYSVVGVVPDEADFGLLQVLSAAAYSRGFADRSERTRVDVWTPLQPDPESLPRDTHPIFVLGRLAPGATLISAQHETAAIATDLEHQYPANDGRGVFVEPLGEVVFGPVRPALFVLLGAVGLVLLVASVNVTSLLLARGATRFREVAIRTALGAGTARLARQFLIENLILTLGAAATGVGLAFAGLKGLLAIAPADVPRLSVVSIDIRVLLATLGLSLLVGLVFGMVPTLQARRVDLQTALKSDGGISSSAGHGRSRVRAALVIAELALAFVLVVGAGLLIKSFWQLRQVDPGFRAEGVLKVEYQLPPGRYPADFAAWPNFKEMHAFTGALLRRIGSLPGVESAALAGNHPLDPGFTNSFAVVGREAEARTWPEISVRRVTPGYFRTVGLSLVRGRLLRDSDATFAEPVLLVNEVAARRFFPGTDPLGAQIHFWGAARTIVGVVANERFHGLAAAPPPGVYVPLAQAPSANGAGVLLVRTSGDPIPLASPIRAAVRDTDPGLAVFGIEPLDETMSRSVSERRFTMLLLGLFAALALTLAAIGIHGVLSHSVARRTREIGVRVALGARPWRVVQLVLSEGVVLTLAGLALGLAGAFALTRLLGSLLYGTTPTDPAMFIGVPLFLMVVALAAAYIPARRATKVDPAVALRTE
jgi:predicted permease